ncbi:MAG TPA: ATP-binding protein [Pyrinomonadaceae bacterium]|nr:ATP-binding protein [Pyrinomonadaceae bacterium]
MSPLEILQLIGYSTAAALHFWIGALLVRGRRRFQGKIERVLTILAFAMGVWHGSNFLASLHAMLGLSGALWDLPLRVVSSLAVLSITLSYSLLLHVHLHLWADARGRSLTMTERARVYLSYLPTIFLVYAVPKLWTGAYAPMFVRLAHLLLPFALWATYVLCLVAITDLLIARSTKSPSERRLMRTLGASFFVIAALISGVYALGIGRGSALGLYLQTLANLGSLMPTALLAYHIYRYRYLELIIKESLIVASFAAVVLVAYLYGIRTFGEWLTARYGLRAGAVESILILMLALVAAPLRRWLDKRFRQLFEREAALYREVAARIGAHAGRYKQLPELLRFVEERIVNGLGLQRVHLFAFDGEPHESDNAGEGWHHPSHNEAGGGGVAATDGVSAADNVSAAADASALGDSRKNPENESASDRVWQRQVIECMRKSDDGPIEGEPLLRQRGYSIAYALRRDNREVGLMLVDAAPEALTYDVRTVLEMLAGQVAIAIEDCRLVEENVRLERRVAQGERLAALGQMAATVAHEVKNPLSAIKSIAQVMREDEYLKQEYTRDLDLIVGETDRLSRSVTQMLSFARHAPQQDATQRADELVRSILELFRGDAEARGVSIVNNFESSPAELDGVRASAVRDALTNLLLNALQATPSGRAVTIEARAAQGMLLLSVVDGGAGVPLDNRERIWEPFFTTRQRGTGLGLAIVRKRIEEVGGAARLAQARSGEGARFELTVPLRAQPETL